MTFLPEELACVAGSGCGEERVKKMRGMVAPFKNCLPWFVLLAPDSSGTLDQVDLWSD